MCNINSMMKGGYLGPKTCPSHQHALPDKGCTIKNGHQTFRYEMKYVKCKIKRSSQSDESKSENNRQMDVMICRSYDQ